MSESLMAAPASPWLASLKPVFDEGRDTPIKRAAQLAVWLGSGRADALSGRVVSARDEPESVA